MCFWKQQLVFMKSFWIWEDAVKQSMPPTLLPLSSPLDHSLHLCLLQTLHLRLPLPQEQSWRKRASGTWLLRWNPCVCQRDFGEYKLYQYLVFSYLRWDFESRDSCWVGVGVIYNRGPQPPGYGLVRICGLLGTGLQSRRWAPGERVKLCLCLQQLPTTCVTAWALPMIRSLVALDFYMNANPAMNCAWERSRLRAPHENLMPDDMILYYGELYNYFIIYYNIIIVEVECTINVMHSNHWKLVCGAKKIRDHWLMKRLGPCQCPASPHPYRCPTVTELLKPMSSWA